MFRISRYTNKPVEKTQKRCINCEVCFESFEAFEDHIEEHKNNRIMRCMRCKAKFNRSLISLKEHVAVFCGIGVTNCPICLMKFHSPAVRAIHKFVRPYHCKLCKMCSGSKDFLVMHKPRNETCVVCRAQFKCCAGFKQHSLTHAPTLELARSDKSLINNETSTSEISMNEKVVGSDTRGVKIKSSERVQSETVEDTTSIVTFHASPIEEYAEEGKLFQICRYEKETNFLLKKKGIRCSTCQVAVRYEPFESLADHVAAHNSGEIVRCVKCNSIFNQSIISLAEHIAVFCGIEMSSCPICLMKFLSPAFRVIHKFVRPYHCTECKMCSALKGFAIMHKPRKEWMKCNICLIHFKCFTHYEQHCLTHKPSPRRPLMTDTYVASKEFSQSTCKRTYGVKASQCSQCSMVFTNSDSIDHHLGEENYKCPHCPIVLRAKGCLEYHLSYVHEISKPQITNNLLSNTTIQEKLSGVVKANVSVSIKLVGNQLESIKLEGIDMYSRETEESKILNVNLEQTLILGKEIANNEPAVIEPATLGKEVSFGTISEVEVEESTSGKMEINKTENGQQGGIETNTGIHLEVIETIHSEVVDLEKSTWGSYEPDLKTSANGTVMNENLGTHRVGITSTSNQRVQSETSGDILKAKSYIIYDNQETVSIEEFVCVMCGATFSNLDYFVKHVETHIDFEVESRCLKCNAMFSTKTLLEEHNLFSCMDHICRICGKSFKTAALFKEHQIKKPLHCEECKMCFYSQKIANKHKISPEVKKGSSFMCEKCNVTFKCPGGLLNHNKLHNQKSTEIAPNYVKNTLLNKASQKCELCDLSFPCFSSLRYHLGSFHKTGLKSTGSEKDTNPTLLVLELEASNTPKPRKRCRKCGECDFTCRNGKIMLKHKQSCHKEEGKEVCKECGAKFQYQTLLATHSLKVHGHDKVFKCEFCEYGANTSKSLKVHLRIHTGERPFECEHCGKSFKQTGALRDHLRSHSESRPFQCDFCNQRFKLISALRRHQKLFNEGAECKACSIAFPSFACLKYHDATIHPKVVRKRNVTQKIKHFQCKKCGKEFKCKDKLNEHIKTHPMEDVLNIYKCYECNLSFKFTRQLTKHQHIHHSIDPSKCPWCNSPFKSRKSMLRHKDTCSQRGVTNMNNVEGPDEAYKDLHTVVNDQNSEASKAERIEEASNSPINKQFSSIVNVKLEFPNLESTMEQLNQPENITNMVNINNLKDTYADEYVIPHSTLED